MQKIHHKKYENTSEDITGKYWRAKLLIYISKIIFNRDNSLETLSILSSLKSRGTNGKYGGERPTSSLPYNNNYQAAATGLLLSQLRYFFNSIGFRSTGLQNNQKYLFYSIQNKVLRQIRYSTASAISCSWQWTSTGGEGEVQITLARYSQRGHPVSGTGTVKLTSTQYRINGSI